MTPREIALEHLSPMNYGDMIYKLTKGEAVEYVAVSHDECIVGLTEGLSGVLHYGDNAYYWLAGKVPQLAKLGWSGEKL